MDPLYLDSSRPKLFGNATDANYPPLTPLLGDAVYTHVCPEASDPPPRDLFGGGSGRSGIDMALLAVPRHGNRPNPVPTDWPPDKPLPGAVNVSFFDGHGELVKLDHLYQLYWHKDYRPPAKRPGLR